MKILIEIYCVFRCRNHRRIVFHAVNDTRGSENNIMERKFISHNLHNIVYEKESKSEVALKYAQKTGLFCINDTYIRIYFT